VVRFTVTFAAAGNESWRLLEALRPSIVSTHPGHGCVAWTLSVSSESGRSQRLRYVEDWSSEQELRDRVRSERFRGLLAAMEAALTRPRIVFELATGSRGLEFVEEVRQAAGS
jgi:quinol monooxygenase YgiN